MHRLRRALLASLAADLVRPAFRVMAEQGVNLSGGLRRVVNQRPQQSRLSLVVRLASMRAMVSRMR
jgi:hypothetical protein